VADSKEDVGWTRCQGRAYARAWTAGSRGTVPNPQTEPATRTGLFNIYWFFCTD